jgi:hypothetical protein
MSYCFNLRFRTFHFTRMELGLSKSTQIVGQSEVWVGSGCHIVRTQPDVRATRDENVKYILASQCSLQIYDVEHDSSSVITQEPCKPWRSKNQTKKEYHLMSLSHDPTIQLKGYSRTPAYYTNRVLSAYAQLIHDGRVALDRREVLPENKDKTGPCHAWCNRVMPACAAHVLHPSSGTSRGSNLEMPLSRSHPSTDVSSAGRPTGLT